VIVVEGSLDWSNYSPRAILIRMIRVCFCLTALMWAPAMFAQATDAASSQPPKAVITKLSPPFYPPIALAARVSGKVELIITISSDGTALSSTVRSGPQMLRQPAIDSATQSHFVCVECKDAAKQFRMSYSFEIGEVITCAETEPIAPATSQVPVSYPRISQSASTVTVVDRAFGTCDPEVTLSKIRARSAKCLYLWRCGWQ
jgi:hypothetical protein